METPTQPPPVTVAHSAPPPLPKPVVPLHDHPEPAGRGYGWVWLLVLAALGAAAYFLYPKYSPYLHLKSASSAGPQQRGPREIPVLVGTAKKGNLDQYLNGLGTVTPYNTVTVRPRVDGEIMKILFQEGQEVKEGQPLIEIDPRPFDVMLTQAQGQYARDAAQLKNAKLDLERFQSAGISAVGQQQIDTQKALIEQYEGVLKNDQGLIDNAKLQLVYCHIIAPIAGRIGLRQVDVGNIVHANDAEGLATITQLHPISVVFTIPQDAISRIVTKPNGGEGMLVEAWNRDFTKKIATGKLQAINNQVDPQTGTLKLKASFENKENTLFPSQFVNARLLVDTLEDVTLVPSAAIQRGPDSTFVYLVKPGQKEGEKVVELRNVKVGASEGDQTVVTEGLKPGDVAVTDGVDKLVPGTKVVPRQPGQKPGGAGNGATTRATTSRPAGAGAAASGKGSAE